MKGAFFVYIFWVLFYLSLVYLIIKTGKITLYRKILFISITLFFLAGFKIFINPAKYYSGPACPLAISSTSLATIRNLIFNFPLWPYFVYAFLWLAFVLLIGRIWCSWICWFGGIDECFASISKKKLTLPQKLIDLISELPSAVLLFSLLATLSTGTAVFCLWICPLKMSVSFLPGEYIIKLLQIISFISIGIVFLIILPLLTGKRTFCRFICPLRAVLRWSSFVHPSRININLDKCTKCDLCIKACSSSAIDKEYSISPYCNFCLECLEVCKEKAIETKPHCKILISFAMLLSFLVSLLIITEIIKCIKNC